MKIQAQRILRISRVVRDLDRAAAFYRDALGFEVVSRGPALGPPAADEVVMRLGEASVALVCCAGAGNDYPVDSRSNDLWFQHLAIVVSDMDAAYAHLVRAAGWQAISQGGPQQLPPANGSVRAFKFRDPDGHPLELLWFPNRLAGPLFSGVDHSALAVSSTQRSAAFYGALGFRVSERSLNHGPAQDRLDAISGAHVNVTALRPLANDGPGLELLGYMPPGRAAGAIGVNDVAADVVTIEVSTLYGEVRRAVRDPDGHRLLLVDQGCGVPA